MRRFLLAILLTISTFAVVSHGVMVYKLSATAFIIAEEESSDEKPLAKESKEMGKDTIAHSLPSYRRFATGMSYKTGMSETFHCSKGFSNRPFNPPDHS